MRSARQRRLAATGRNRERGRASWLLLLRKDGIERTARRAFEIGAGGPVVADGVQIVAIRVDLLATREQQLEDAEEHRVVAELRLLHEALTQRQEDLAVVVDDSAIREEPVAQLADLGTDIHGQLLLSGPRLPDLRRDSRGPCLALVEDGQFHRQVRADD